MKIEKCINLFSIIIIILCCKFKFNCNTYKKRLMKINIGVWAEVTREAAAPQIVGNSDFLGSKRKFGQSQFLQTFFY